MNQRMDIGYMSPNLAVEASGEKQHAAFSECHRMAVKRGADYLTGIFQHI